MSLSPVDPETLESDVELRPKFQGMRKRYDHGELDLHHIEVAAIFYIDVVGSEFDPEWLHAELMQRMEIPQAPEDFPNVETYYLTRVDMASIVEAEK